MSTSTKKAGGGADRPKAPIVGLGVGGMSAALGLTKAGWDVQVVEKSAERRTGGYFIGLSKEGFEAARYLGVIDALKTHTPEDNTTWEISQRNRRRAGMSFTDQPNHPEVVLRGDIEEALWSGFEEHGIPVRFSTVPETIGTNAELANVRLRDTATGESSDETFDLVVGADGLRSSVRRQVFGPDEDFLHPLNRIICAFQLGEAPPNTSPTDGLIVAEEKRSLWIFPFSDQPPTALFTYIPDDVDSQFQMNRADALRHAYAGMNGDGVVSWALDQFDHASTYLFDSVHKVEMPRWHHNRVVLVGDAAWLPHPVLRVRGDRCPPRRGQPRQDAHRLPGHRPGPRRVGAPDPALHREELRPDGPEGAGLRPLQPLRLRHPVRATHLRLLQPLPGGTGAQAAPARERAQLDLRRARVAAARHALGQLTERGHGSAHPLATRAPRRTGPNSDRRGACRSTRRSAHGTRSFAASAGLRHVRPGVSETSPRRDEAWSRLLARDRALEPCLSKCVVRHRHTETLDDDEG